LEGTELLPDVNERRRRRVESRNEAAEARGNRALLPGLLEDYGLYPWRVQLIAEGPTEIIALRTIVEEGYALSFEMLGVAATDLGGADIPENAESLLGAFRGYANYFFLVFDNEGRAKEMIEALVRATVIEGIGEKGARRSGRRALRQPA
jgi:hypothetical protein